MKFNQSSDVKPGRGQFKCFHCRQIFASKDGDWFPWDKMEVHLCKECEKNTRKRPERKTASRFPKELSMPRPSRGVEARL